MQVSVTQAKGQLAKLIRRAAAGEEVVLTRHGRAVAKLVPVERRRDAGSIRAAIAQIQASAASKPSAGPCAARSQDFLYGDDGLPK